MKNRRYAHYTFLMLLMPVIGISLHSIQQETAKQSPDSPSAQSPRVELLGLKILATAQAAEVSSQRVIEIDWDQLIPADWNLEKIMADYEADGLSDDDPRAKELMEKLQTFWKEAPVVKDLDGRRVKIPGFVVPLDMNTNTIGEFLLVPYYGACIHVPPPPSNQTVHVVTQADSPYKGELFDTVWVTGTLKVQSSSSDLGEAGYRIDATRVEPYE